MPRKNNSVMMTGVCAGCGREYATLAPGSCGECGGSIVAAGPPGSAKPAGSSLRSLRYPTTYLLFVLMAAADLILTFLIVWMAGTHAEVNVVAREIIERLGLPGAVAFKFTLVMFIITMCEVIGHRQDKTGRTLAEWCVAATAIPVVVSSVQLFAVA
ncbi:MAG TPA: hypothetical protein VM243_04175 [Phycisphaerae bacterium]|nr:hypothetical protein [Phycisphaerae bacterium]